MVIINDPKIAIELFEKRSTKYSSRPKSYFAGEMYVLQTVDQCWRRTDTDILSSGLAGRTRWAWHPTTTNSVCSARAWVVLLVPRHRPPTSLACRRRRLATSSYMCLMSQAIPFPTFDGELACNQAPLVRGVG